MINPEILKILETNFQDPSYSIVISNFNQEEFCNKDRLEISVQQFSPNLEKIIENKEGVIKQLKDLLTTNGINIPRNLYELKINSCIEKTLNIESFLDSDENQLFFSRLTGNLNNDKHNNLTNRTVKGTIKNKKITITLSDNPNYIANKIRLKGNQLILGIPKNIDTFEMSLKNNTTNATAHITQNNIENDKITRTIHTDNTYTFEISYTIKDSIMLQDIESIVTPLTEEIEIGFQNTYTKTPAVIVTIDENNKVYSSYETTFKKNKKKEFTGVTVKFNKIKKQKKYGDVNITIIGYNATSD